MMNSSRYNSVNFFFVSIFFLAGITLIYPQSKSVKVTYEYYCCKPLQYDVELISNQKMSKYTNFREKEKFDMDWYQMKTREMQEECFYDYESKKYIENSIFERKPIYANWEIDYKWDITNETKKIIGYTVIKATRDIERTGGVEYGKAYAWFCPDIPFFTGPKDNLGLPGLVLETGYTKVSIERHKAKKIEFLDEELPISSKTKGIEVSKFYIKNPFEMSRSYLRKQAKKNKSK